MAPDDTLTNIRYCIARANHQLAAAGLPIFHVPDPPTTPPLTSARQVVRYLDIPRQYRRPPREPDENRRMAEIERQREAQLLREAEHASDALGGISRADPS